VTLTWDISELRARGDRISLAALVVALGMIAYGVRRRAPAPALPGRFVRWIGLGGAAAGAVVLVARARPIDDEVVGYGLRGGMDATYDLGRLDVGAFDDTEPFRPTRVLRAAWGARTLDGAHAARILERTDVPAAVVALAPAGDNRITLFGADATSNDASAVLVLRDRRSQTEVCRFDAKLGAATTVPAACTAGEPGEGPGVSRELQIRPSGTLRVTGIAVDDGTVFLEGEEMHNVLDDSGYEAFYTYGPPDQYSSNGVSMVAHTTYEMPIALDSEVTLPMARYEVWLLTRTVSSRLVNGRAHFLVESDGHRVADVDPATRKDLPFWDDDPHQEWVDAGPMDGGGAHRVRVTFYKLKTEFDGLGDLDAMAFVPSP
jgi:hypothetical protein